MLITIINYYYCRPVNWLHLYGFIIRFCCSLPSKLLNDMFVTLILICAIKSFLDNNYELFLFTIQVVGNNKNQYKHSFYSMHNLFFFKLDTYSHQRLL